MAGLFETSSSGLRRGSVFQNTRWSQVHIAGRLDAPGAKEALETLCRAYWQPIYAFLRRYGHEHQDAQDLTQGFFFYLLEENLFEKANPHKGRFRSFLLGSLKRFVSNEQAKKRALKRGGGACLISLDAGAGTPGQSEEPVTQLTPERLFDRKWALVVVGGAMERLGTEYRRAGMAGEFVLLQPYLTGEPGHRLLELASQLNKSEEAARVQVFRLRSRFRKLIRAVIAETVCDTDEVESELRQLQAALRDG